MAALALQLRAQHRIHNSRTLVHLFSSSSSSDDKNDTPPSPPPVSSLLSEVRASLRQSPPPMPHRLSQSPPLSHSQSNFLLKFPAQTAPPQSTTLQELYERNMARMGGEGVTSTAGGAGMEGTKATADFESIRRSLRNFRPAKTEKDKGADRFNNNAFNPLSLDSYKQSLKIKPNANIAGTSSPVISVSGGLGSQTQTAASPFSSGKGFKGKSDSKSELVLLRDCKYEELGERLRELRPANATIGKNCFSLSELKERLQKLREIEEKESVSSIGGLSFADLRGSLIRMHQDVEEKNKKSSAQMFDILGHLSGRPKHMRSPPKEQLVEKAEMTSAYLRRLSGGIGHDLKAAAPGDEPKALALGHHGTTIIAMIRDNVISMASDTRASNLDNSEYYLDLSNKITSKIVPIGGNWFVAFSGFLPDWFSLIKSFSNWGTYSKENTPTLVMYIVSQAAKKIRDLEMLLCGYINGKAKIYKIDKQAKKIPILEDVSMKDFCVAGSGSDYALEYVRIIMPEDTTMMTDEQKLDHLSKAIAFAALNDLCTGWRILRINIKDKKESSVTYYLDCYALLRTMPLEALSIQGLFIVREFEKIMRGWHRGLEAHMRRSILTTVVRQMLEMKCMIDIVSIGFLGIFPKESDSSIVLVHSIRFDGEKTKIETLKNALLALTRSELSSCAGYFKRTIC